MHPSASWQTAKATSLRAIVGGEFRKNAGVADGAEVEKLKSR
jgi:hypothetical protein